MIKTQKYIEKIKIKKSWIIIIAGMLALGIVATIIMLNFDTFESKLPDNHSNILVVQENRLSINEIFTKENEVESLATRYGAVYKDGVNRQNFVFSIPLREKEGSKYILLENKIYENEDGTFGTRNKNFNITFNRNYVNLKDSSLEFSILLNNNNIAKEENYLTIYNETKDVVKYSSAINNIDIRFIPTYNGVSMELDLINKIESNIIEFEIDIGGLTFENDDAGFVHLFGNKDERVGVIYQGILVCGNNKFYPNNTVKIVEKSKKYYLTVNLANIPPDVIYPAKLSLNFDFYFEKVVFNTSVYESTPKINTTLNNVNIFDTINKNSRGYTYLKYKPKSITPKNPSLIDSFEYNFYAIYVQNSVEIEVYRIPKDWCSWNTNWKNKPNNGEKIGEFTLSEVGWHTIDLTDYVKNLIERDYDGLDTNSIALKIKDGDKGYAILASANNSSVPPYLEVNYRMQ